jgi:flagellar hook-associated protein 2
MGMDLQLDGTMQFNTVSYQKAVASGLAGKLATGLNMGYASVSNNLETFLTSQIDPASGALASEISAEKSKVADMQKRQSDLQEHLNGIQNNYITQYSALNALLFQLNATSTSLTSALTAITNINAGK